MTQRGLERQFLEDFGRAVTQRGLERQFWEDFGRAVTQRGLERQFFGGFGVGCDAEWSREQGFLEDLGWAVTQWDHLKAHAAGTRNVRRFARDSCVRACRCAVLCFFVKVLVSGAILPPAGRFSEK